MRLTKKTAQLVLLGILVVGALLMPLPAFAQYPPAQGDLTVNATTVPPGGTVQVSGDGYCPGRAVVVSLTPSGGGTPRVLGTFTANSQGQFSGTVTIPADTAPGAYTLQASGLRNDCRVTARVLGVRITVSAPAAPPAAAPGQLSVTGIDALPWALTGLGVILLGAVAIVISRKRRTVTQA